VTQVQVLDRTFDILERLAAAGRDLGVSELHAELGLPLGTIHRLLENLVRRGYAAQDAATRRYGPGPKLLEIGALALVSARFDLHRIAHQQLEALTAATGETSNQLETIGTTLRLGEPGCGALLIQLELRLTSATRSTSAHVSLIRFSATAPGDRGDLHGA
jgi:DNA-binding Lrp family transcriptional regulator